MAVHLFGPGIKIVQRADARRAQGALNDGQHMFVNGPVVIDTVVVNVNVRAVRRGVYYEVHPNAFEWNSKDGIMRITNPSTISGGALVQDGDTTGTLIQPLRNSDPFPTNVYREDEDV